MKIQENSLAGKKRKFPPESMQGQPPASRWTERAGFWK